MEEVENVYKLCLAYCLLRIMLLRSFLMKLESGQVENNVGCVRCRMSVRIGGYTHRRRYWGDRRGGEGEERRGTTTVDTKPTKRKDQDTRERVKGFHTRSIFFKFSFVPRNKKYIL